MNSLAKWVWLIIAVILFIGTNIVWYILATVVTFLLVWRFRPEWLEENPDYRKTLARNRIVNKRIKKLTKKYGHNLFVASEERNAKGHYVYFWLTVDCNKDGKDTESPFFEDDLLKISFAISNDFKYLDMRVFNKTDNHILVDWENATFMELPLSNFIFFCKTRGTFEAQKTTRVSISKKITTGKIFSQTEMRNCSIFYPFTFTINTQDTITKDYSFKLQSNCIE